MPRLVSMPEANGLAPQVLVAEDTAPLPPKKRRSGPFPCLSRPRDFSSAKVPSEKTLDGGLVDMAELLLDNIKLLRQEAAMPRLSSDSKAIQILLITT